MDLNAYWALVGRSAVEASDQDERLEWLSAAPPSPGFAPRPDEARRRVGTSAHGQAAGVVCAGPCPADGFLHVLAWPDADRPGWEGREVAFESYGLPAPAGEPWDSADPAAISARVPRLGALSVPGKVA